MTTFYTNVVHVVPAYILKEGDHIGVEFGDTGNTSNYILVEGDVNTPPAYYELHSWSSFTNPSNTVTGGLNMTIMPLNGGNAIDEDTVVYWKSDTEINPAIYIDTGALKQLGGIAIYLHADTTETEIKIRVGANTNFVDGENSRTILVSKLTKGAWNYIRFNFKLQRYIQIIGSSGLSTVLAISEIKYLSKTDNDLKIQHGHLTISNSDLSLGLDGV